MDVAVHDESEVAAVPEPVADALIETLYKDAYLRLVRHLYAMTGDIDEAQEVVQEAFVRAVARPRSVLRADDPEAWLRTVARNLARNRFRRRTWMERFVRRNRHEHSIAAYEPNRVAIVAAMRQLSPVLRETVGLFYLADMSIDDISTALDTSTGTVKARLSRGRAALAAILGTPDERA